MHQLASRLVLSASFALVACGGPGTDDLPPEGATDGDPVGDTGDAPEDETGAESSDAPTWHQDIAPLVATRCASCHHDDGIAFSMATYAQAMPWAPVMAMATETGEMPPWHALETDECSPPHAYEGDARLTQTEIDLFADWADAQAPEGDPATAAPLPPPPATDLADPTVAMTMGREVTVEREGSKLDFFHCLSFDPGNTEDVYIDAMQVIPGNSKIAHHVLIYVDAAAESAAWSGGVYEDCDGGAGIGAPVLVGAWVPGARPIETPDDVGIRLPAGARLVFNMHYHADVEGPQTDDATGLALRFSSDTPEWISEFRLVGNPGLGTSTTGEFLIPAGEADHTETIEWELPALPGDDVRIWAIGNHMHKVGIDMKTSVIRSGDETCMVQTPDWDFDWQRLYEFDAPIADTVAVQPGDTLRVRCTYDNSMSNPQMVEALDEVGLDAPRDVSQGDGTLDEMCTAGIGIAVRL